MLAEVFDLIPFYSWNLINSILNWNDEPAMAARNRHNMHGVKFCFTINIVRFALFWLLDIPSDLRYVQFDVIHVVSIRPLFNILVIGFYLIMLYIYKLLYFSPNFVILNLLKECLLQRDVRMFPRKVHHRKPVIRWIDSMLFRTKIFLQAVIIGVGKKQKRVLRSRS